MEWAFVHDHCYCRIAPGWLRHRGDPAHLESQWEANPWATPKGEFKPGGVQLGGGKLARDCHVPHVLVALCFGLKPVCFHNSN